MNNNISTQVPQNIRPKIQSTGGIFFLNFLILEAGKLEIGKLI